MHITPSVYLRIAVIAAVALAMPRSSLGAGSPRVETRDNEANRAFRDAIADRAKDPQSAIKSALEAAGIWADITEQTPETPETSEWRQDRITRALNAYGLAFSESHECPHLDRASRTIEKYLESVEPDSKQYQSVEGGLRDLQKNGPDCPGNSAPLPTPEIVEPTSTPEGPEEPVRPAASTSSSEPSDTGNNRKTYKYLAVSSGVLTAVSFAVTAGAGLSRIRKPFEGAAYRAIYDAAIASQNDNDSTNDVPIPSDDMCAVARGDGTPINQDVVSACNRWDTLGKVTIATGVLGGVFAASTVVFAILATRKRSGKLRASTFQLGISHVSKRGMMLGGNFRF